MRCKCDIQQGRRTPLDPRRGGGKEHQMENSLLETRYFEIVKSRDLEFLDLSSAVIKETVYHGETLKKKIGTLK
jgi:hypothetical protein